MLNLRNAAKRNAASDIEQGKHYKKEELEGRWLTIERVGLVDKDDIRMGKPVLTEDGEAAHLLWAQFRFKEIPDGYFRGFGTLTNMVKEWVAEADGDLEAINAELAENPIKIRMYKTSGRAWMYDVE